MPGNVDVLEDVYDRFGRGGIAGVPERLDPAIGREYGRGADPLPLFVARRRRGEVVGFFEALGASDVRRLEPIASLGGKDTVAVPIHPEMRREASGRAIRDLEGAYGRSGGTGSAPGCAMSSTRASSPG